MYYPSRVTNNGRGRQLVGFEYAHQRSSEAGEAPSLASLADGEVAVNSADGCLFVKKSNGTVGTVPGAEGFIKIESLTQAAYDALVDATATIATTLYIVVPNP